MLAAMIGILCALLVLSGNPGNMGICGACFLRDAAGAVGLFSGPGPKYFRPELVGVLFGALLLTLATGKYQARSGGYAATRFFFSVWMAWGSLVFLGCPFRWLQRLGGGDANALAALPGLALGVGIGLWFERRGYQLGKTAPVPTPVGLLGPPAFAGLGLLFVGGIVTLSQLPAHAPWYLSLGISLGVGALLSLTGFCAISAMRQLYQKKRPMLGALALLVFGYAAVMLIAGKWSFSFAGQPAAHSAHLWNNFALLLVGLTGCLVGGCPVRQLVMAGEGNGDAWVSVMGLLVGGALAHTLGLASSGAGPTVAGQWAVVVGIALSGLYAFWITRSTALSQVNT